MLAGGFIALCMASTDFTQLENTFPTIPKDNTTGAVSIKFVLIDIHRLNMSIIIVIRFGFLFRIMLIRSHFMILIFIQ